MFKVYVTDYDYSDLEIEKSIYGNYPIEFIPLKCRNEHELIRKAEDADALHNQYLRLTKKTFSSLRNLKIVSRYGVGVDNIDINDAKIFNITIKNVPDYCVEEMSNHALAMILYFARKIKRADMMIKGGVWDFNKLKPIHEFGSYKIGIIGFGRIGRMLGKKLICSGFNVLYVNDIDKTVVEKIDYYNDNIKMVALPELLKNSDFISLNVSLNEKTKHLINGDNLKYVKDNVTIINTSRGQVINEKDLYDFLKKHPNANAGLDVLQNEPPDINNNDLFKLNNITYTPHIGFYSEESIKRLRKTVCLNIIDCLLKK